MASVSFNVDDLCSTLTPTLLTVDANATTNNTTDEDEEDIDIDEDDIRSSIMPGKLSRSILGKNVWDRAVRVSWLKNFVKDNPETLSMKTHEVQNKVIVPKTCEDRIHYCTLIDEENVGRVDCFISHAWGSPFKDLVSCIFRFCPDETRVWLDLFAVFQHSKDIKMDSKGSDERKMLGNELKFENVVEQATSFLLCISPPEDMENMDPEEILAGNVVLDGDNARRIPTQRIWCLAEIMAAVSHKKPVVMGVGTAKDKLVNNFCFAKPKTTLNMLKLIDVEKAQSWEPADKVRILKSIRAEGKKLMNVENDVTWLNYAVKGALTSALTLSQCKDICGADPEDYISIFRAVISNSDKELIEDFKRKKFTDQQLNYSLTCVAGGGYTNVLKVLLEEPFKLNPAAQLESSGDTPLHYAAQGGQLETIDILKENGADLNIVNHHGWSALVYAATDGQVKSVEKLNEIGADMNVTSGSIAKGMTTVMYCLAGNKLDILQTLKKCGANLDLQTADGITAVMFAVAAERKEGNENDWRFLNELVKGKANLDKKTTKKGRTALMWAVQNNREDAAQILLDGGAKVNERDVDGLTALMLAVQEGHTGPAELLRKCKADVNLKDNKGWTYTDWKTNTQRALKRAKTKEVISKDIDDPLPKGANDIDDPLPKGANENRSDSQGTRYMWNLRNKLLRAGNFEERREEEESKNVCCGILLGFE